MEELPVAPHPALGTAGTHEPKTVPVLKVVMDEQTSFHPSAGQLSEPWSMQM